MKKNSLLAVVIVMTSFSALSQKASDVIENGIKIKQGHEVFVKFDGTNILYHLGDAPNDLRFKKIEDSAMLLPVDGSVIFYMRPLNPLNYSYKSENKIITDPIDSAAATALTSIVDFLKKRTGAEAVVSDPFCPEISEAVRMYNTIFSALSKDQKNTIKTTFNDLKALDFNIEQETKDAVKKAEKIVNDMAVHYDSLQNNINELKKEVEKFSCEDKNEHFIAKQVFAAAVKDLEITLSNQKKRFTNLVKVFKLVKTAQEDASKLSWLIKLNEVPATKGKISVFTIKVSEAGYKLSDEGEIVEMETKDKASKTVRVRRFQRFVPEVSVGVAYTNLSFPKYSSKDNGSGSQVVADAGEDKINKLNFTTMINYNLFLNNSPIHPFWQIGIGVNADFPTLLTGVGLRVNAQGAKRLALSFGIATTWIKTLDKLKIGAIVTGPADVEKDTKYKFNTKPKPYFGIQYNF